SLALRVSIVNLILACPCAAANTGTSNKSRRPVRTRPRRRNDLAFGLPDTPPPAISAGTTSSHSVANRREPNLERGVPENLRRGHRFPFCRFLFLRLVVFRYPPCLWQLDPQV